MKKIIFWFSVPSFHLSCLTAQGNYLFSTLKNLYLTAKLCKIMLKPG